MGFPLDSYQVSMTFFYCGISLGFLGSIGFLWDVHDSSIGFLCGFYDVSMGFLWEFHDVSMTFFYGITMGYLKGTLWDSYGISLWFRCYFHVISMILLDFCGIPMGFL